MTRFRFSVAPILAAALIGLVCLVILRGAEAQANVPGASTVDLVTPRAGWLFVEWSTPSSDGGSAITDYDVRHIETDADESVDANWTETHDVWTGGDLQYQLRNLANDTQYDVQVRAVNVNGDGAWSSTVTGTPVVSAATAPTLDAVRGDDKAVSATWNAPTTLLDPDATYDLRYILTSADETVDGNWTVMEDARTGSRLLEGITGLTNDSEYDVQVRVVEFDNAGPWSATTSATPGDVGADLANATEITLEVESSGKLKPAGSHWFWGNIDSSTDVDYFKVELTETQSSEPVGFWFYTLGALDTVGELQSSDGSEIKGNDYGRVLPDTENFFIWRTLDRGVYYIKVTGYGDNTGDYLMRVRTFTDSTGRSDAHPLLLGRSTSAMIDPDDDDDYFKLTLAERTDVILRSSGFPDTEATLLTGNVSNDDGNLLPALQQFLIRRTLNAGSHYLRVGSFSDDSDGPFSVYATEALDPGNTRADAVPLTLGDAAGGNITSDSDVDYFRLDLEYDTYVSIWTSKLPDNVDTDGQLLDKNGDPVPDSDIDFQYDFRSIAGFGIEDHLPAGTYYIKVTRDTRPSANSGRYVIRAREDVRYARLVSRCKGITTSISDPLYGCQWHLNNDGQFRTGATTDINVEDVWADNNLGAGVTVAVVDSGMHFEHEDLIDNVDQTKNHDYTGGDGIYDPSSFHGTAVAGLIAGKDNAIGMRGVAPRATIYAYNYLADTTDENEADAMSRNANTTAISNNSWGTRDAGVPTIATEIWYEAVEAGATTGYGGKGVLYVWSAGNGGDYGDYSNLDEMNNSFYTTTVCAVGHNDERAPYSEGGPNLWVCAPSSSQGGKQPEIYTTDNGNRYMDDFGGTSAAAPIVSGVAALVRSENTDLTWRDVKLILAASARKNDPSHADWETGAEKYGDAGSYEFNHDYGFGMVDAKAAVDLADGWTNVPPLRVSRPRPDADFTPIPDATEDAMGVVTPGAVHTRTITLDGHVEFIEYVHVFTYFNHRSIRDLDIELESPAGTVSKLVPFYDRDEFGEFVPLYRLSDRFRLGSAKHLGESAKGTWTLRVRDHIPADTGTLPSWSIQVFGHGITPLAPKLDRLRPASGGYTVGWKAPRDTGQSAISAFDVRHILTSADETDDANWTVVDNAWTSGELQYTASGLTGSAQYDVQVRAVNSGGDGLWSKTETVTTDPTDAPTIASVVPGNGSISLSWDAPADTTIGTIDSYDVRYKRSSSGSWTVVDSAWTTGNLEYTVSPDPPLTNGVKYDVQVRAAVGSTDHSWSSSRQATPRTVPGAPTLYSLDSPSDGDGEVVAEWNAPGSNGGAAITSYDVRYIRSDASAADKADDTKWTLEAVVESTAVQNRKHGIDGLTNWVKYDVQVLWMVYDSVSS